jgi:hypothetical protein
MSVSQRGGGHLERTTLTGARTVVTLLALFVHLGCTSPTQPSGSDISLDRDAVADVLGDHDGTASVDELAALDAYFAANTEAWCVGSFPLDDSASDRITAVGARSAFLRTTTKPFQSEVALRRAYEGVNIRTPYVSVSVLCQDRQIKLVKFYRSPGPGISVAAWDRMTVVGS